MDTDPMGVVGVRPVATDAAVLLVTDDAVAAGLEHVLQCSQAAGPCADHADPLLAERRLERGHRKADQTRKATRVAASMTIASERSRSPASAGAVSRPASSGSLLASASSRPPRTPGTPRRP